MNWFFLSSFFTVLHCPTFTSVYSDWGYEGVDDLSSGNDTSVLLVILPDSSSLPFRVSAFSLKINKNIFKNNKINEIISVVVFCPLSAFRLYAYRQSNTMWRSVDFGNVVSGVVVGVLPPHRRKFQSHRHKFSPAVNINCSEQGRKSSLARNLRWLSYARGQRLPL